MQERIKKIFEEKKVKSKKDFYLLYDSGVSGNKPFCWDTLEDIKKANWKKTICIRPRVKAARNYTVFDIPIEQAPIEIKKMKEMGLDEKNIYFNQSMPNHHLLLQGEVTLTEHGMYLIYSRIQKPMVLALKDEQKHAWGLEAINILKSLMTPGSYGELETIFELFPDSVIELGIYSVHVGDSRGKNTIIWEIRNY